MTRPKTSPSGVAWTAADLAADPHAAPDKADRVRRMFSAIAGRYDLNNRLHSFGRDQAWRRRAVELCRVQPTDQVLDAACGTGDLAIAFARAGAASVTGVDFSESMLERAKAKSQGLKLIGRGQSSSVPRPAQSAVADVARSPARPTPFGRWPWHPRRVQARPVFQLADVTRLPFDDQSFDIVSIAFGIRNVDDTARALCEFRRVLRPGGRLVILEFSRPRDPLVRFFNAIYCERIMPVTASLIAWDRSGAYRYLPRSVRSFLSAEQLAAMLSACGFVDVISCPMTFGVCTATLAAVGAAPPTPRPKRQ